MKLLKAPGSGELTNLVGDRFVLSVVVSAKVPKADFVRTLTALLKVRLMPQPHAAPFPFPRF